MYELPIPLSGHCVVVLNDKMVVFLGGGTGCPEYKPNVYLHLSFQERPNSRKRMEVLFQ